MKTIPHPLAPHSAAPLPAFLDECWAQAEQGGFVPFDSAVPQPPQRNSGTERNPSSDCHSKPGNKRPAAEWNRGTAAQGDRAHSEPAATAADHAVQSYWWHKWPQWQWLDDEVRHLHERYRTHQQAAWPPDASAILALSDVLGQAARVPGETILQDLQATGRLPTSNLPPTLQQYLRPTSNGPAAATTSAAAAPPATA